MTKILKQLLVATAIIIGLSGCITAILGVKEGIQTNAEFNEIVLEDVRQSILLAQKTNDDLALKCWKYVEEFAMANAPNTEAETGNVVGVFSAYQQARNVRRTIVEVKISDAFRLECGPMLTESLGVFSRIGIRLVL